mmetsp:Transcript_117930/g.279908  ORF Transcript_117930/g.279908 Transcript_117930/m.279908 type:complete len:265 (-) Transcript_117930:1542-2336(-)
MVTILARAHLSIAGALTGFFAPLDSLGLLGPGRLRHISCHRRRSCPLSPKGSPSGCQISLLPRWLFGSLEGIGPPGPLLPALLKLNLRDQALLQALAQGVLVQVLSDEDQLLPPVSVGRRSVLLRRVGRPVFGIQRAVQPARTGVDGQSAACLMPNKRGIIQAGHPKPTLGSKNPRLQSSLQQLVQALWMEGLLRSEDQADNPILHGIGHMIPLQFLKPAWHAFGLFHVEAACVQQEARINLAEGRADHFRLGIQLFEKRLQHL